MARHKMTLSGSGCVWQEAGFCKAREHDKEGGFYWQSTGELLKVLLRLVHLIATPGCRVESTL